MPVRHDPDRHRFELQHEGRAAVAEYRREGSTLVLTHTEVPREDRGEGLGDELARFAFKYARDHGLAVSPRCAFMAAWLRRHPEYQDIAK